MPELQLPEKAAILVRQVARKYGEVKLCKFDGQYFREATFNCPFCLDETSNCCMCLDTDKLGVWHCWKCQRTGAKHNLVPASELLEIISEEDFEATIRFRQRETPAVCLPEGLTGDLPDHARAYLSRRSWGFLEAFYCTEGKYAGRIIVPIRNFQRKIISFIAVGGHANLFPKYLYPLGHPQESIFGIDRVVPEDEVVITEGIFDAAPIPNGVAIGGKFLKVKQRQALLDAGVTSLLILLDADAHTEARRMLEETGRWFKSRAILLPTGDPGSIGWSKICQMQLPTLSGDSWSFGDGTDSLTIKW